MLALHYYSDSESVRAALRQVAAAWWCQDDDPVYSKDLIKEFEVEDPPLEDELAWILSKGTAIRKRSLASCRERRERDTVFTIRNGTRFYAALVFHRFN